MLEIGIETYVVDKAKLFWGLECKKKMPGEDLDRWFLVPGGCPFIIEFKKLGEKPGRLQQYKIDNLKRLGYDIEVHDDRVTAILAIAKRMEARALHEKGGKVSARTRSGWALFRSWLAQNVDNPRRHKNTKTRKGS